MYYPPAKFDQWFLFHTHTHTHTHMYRADKRPTPATMSAWVKIWQTVTQTELDTWQYPAWWPPVALVRTLVLFFAICGPKYIELSLPVRKCPMSIVCNAIFRLTMSCCVWEIFAIKSQGCAKSYRNFDVFGRQISGEGATQISDRIL